MRCPRGVRCESCGVEHPEVVVKRFDSVAGELCLTLCPRCAESGVPPPITKGTAARLVEQHQRHLRAQ